jgi:UDP-glucuronate decarboxylase
MDPKDGRVISNFVNQALAGEKLTIYGDGSQTRSLCYVDDLIRGIVAMGALESNPNTPINLGNPVEYTMNELAQYVLYEVKAMRGGHPRDLNLTGLVEYRSLPVDDPKQRRPDISLAREILKWEPNVTLTQGLNRTISYLQDQE